MSTAKPIPQQSVQQRRLAAMIGYAVIFLAAANGIFTFSGARLYVEHILYALLFAVAVQLAISTTLLALPYVRGLSKLVLLGVYAAALTLSTLSAYTYVYNASLPEAQQESLYALDTASKAAISQRLGEAEQAEQRFMDRQQIELAQLERSTDEEAVRGNRSGKGPGRGPEYYRKLESVQDRKAQLAGPTRDLEQARPIYQALNQRLAGTVTFDQRPELASMLAQLRALTNSEETAAILAGIAKNEIGNLRNPVERALLPLKDPQRYSVGVLVSLVWAGMFDLLALFLGVIRYYLLKRENAAPASVHERVLRFATLIYRLLNIREEARAQYRREQGERSYDLPLNSIEMQSFATWLIAGSEVAAKAGGDPGEPLRTLASYMEPLSFDPENSGVGITYQRFEEETRLKPLMAILVQNRVFLNRVEHTCYLLNSSAEMAQKVLIFLRLGMKGSPELTFQNMGIAGLPAIA